MPCYFCLDPKPFWEVSLCLGIIEKYHSLAKTYISTYKYWYQGNLPPVVPEKLTAYFSEIVNVYGNAPRRWKFDQFDN